MVLRAETTTQAGITARRLQAGWDKRCLLDVLHGQYDALARSETAAASGDEGRSIRFTRL